MKLAINYAATATFIKLFSIRIHLPSFKLLIKQKAKHLFFIIFYYFSLKSRSLALACFLGALLREEEEQEEEEQLGWLISLLLQQACAPADASHLSQQH